MFSVFMVRPSFPVRTGDFGIPKSDRALATRWLLTAHLSEIHLSELLRHSSSTSSTRTARRQLFDHHPDKSDLRRAEAPVVQELRERRLRSGPVQAYQSADKVRHRGCFAAGPQPREQRLPILFIEPPHGKQGAYANVTRYRRGDAKPGGLPSGIEVGQQ